MNRHNYKLFLSALFFILGIIIFSAQVTTAYTPLPPTTVIEAQVDKNLLSQEESCLDQSCLFVLKKDEYGDFSLQRTDVKASRPGQNIIGSIEDKVVRLYDDSLRNNDEAPLNEAAFVEALERLIEDDISDIKPILLQEIIERGNLIFTPYDQGKEAELLKQKNQLLNCYYVEYKRAGNWLIKNSATRDYCVGRYKGPLPSAVISYPKFFLYLLTNINETTLPYLAISLALIIPIIGVVGFVSYLFRKKLWFCLKELWFFLKPTKLKIIVTIIAAILLFHLSVNYLEGNLSDFIDFLRYLPLVYLVASLIEYVRFGYVRLKRKSQSKTT